MQRAYLRCRPVRDRLFRPVTLLFAALGFTPDALSLAGIACMAGFAVLAPTRPGAALVLMAVGWAFDLADGALARHLDRATDRGKLADIICDTAVFALLVAGAVNAKLLGPVQGILLAYLMLLSKVLRSIRNARHLETDWHFKAVAGAFPNVIVGLVYGLVLLALGTGRNWFNPVAAPVAIALLVADALRFSSRVLADAGTPSAGPANDG